LNRILIIQTAFIGDVILSTGVIEKLHRFFPEAKIDFLLRKGNESLFIGHPFINQVLIWDKQKKKIINLFHLIKKIRQHQYNYVINFQRFASTGIITALSGAEKTVGFNKNPFSFFFSKRFKHIIGKKDQPKHEIERNNDLIAFLTDNIAEKPKLYLQNNELNDVKKYKLTPYICIAPTSVWKTKQFPSEKWIEFINQIDNIEKIYLLGAQSDFFPSEIIKEKIKPEIVVENLCGKLTFLQSAALMQDAKMNYVNDSAPMHLASAVNAPIAAIYCSTIPEFGFGPVSKTSYIIESKENLYCRPCGLHGYKECPEKHFKCAYSINSQQLLIYL
jgi:ADP-heptose:LPS heptosyltransferase